MQKIVIFLNIQLVGFVNLEKNNNLQTEDLLANIGFDTGEMEPSKVWQSFENSYPHSIWQKMPRVR